MERDYIFGTTKRNGVIVENLKTVGETHIELDGYVQVIKEHADQTITDSFKIVKRYHSSTDAGGNCYDWYEIADHYRYADRTPPIKTDLGTLTEVLNALAGISPGAETEA